MLLVGFYRLVFWPCVNFYACEFSHWNARKFLEDNLYNRQKTINYLIRHFIIMCVWIRQYMNLYINIEKLVHRFRSFNDFNTCDQCFCYRTGNCGIWPTFCCSWKANRWETMGSCRFLPYVFDIGFELEITGFFPQLPTPFRLHTAGK
jgi:hypothetical protein